MLKSIEAYIITNGNGSEAVAFYKDALQAEVISYETFGNNWPECPSDMKDYVMNAQLLVDGKRIMLSDNNPNMFDYQLGHQVSIALISDDVATTQRFFEKLSHNAKNIGMPLQAVPWSPAYGNLTDQFGVNWQLSTEV
ncbi:MULTISPECIES: VOC family protein [unclassified Granulicatella]|uniref:VOC family protein n=1 Tax=unclassified Granulicatella TaxID=2630493 RepID=UPI001073206D|nr:MULTISPECIES: VOC family protein [unclassified Granulicatella]MBF0779568.1 VOC family protein [Granulicatella sp. 19428wC4_WM01]TFU96372.1 VOC family protein [Granulicatella sp. WM01]